MVDTCSVSPEQDTDFVRGNGANAGRVASDGDTDAGASGSSSHKKLLTADIDTRSLEVTADKGSFLPLLQQ